MQNAIRRIKICKPTQAKHFGPNRSKIILKRDFVSTQVKYDSYLTLVDLRNKILEAKNLRRFVDDV